MAPGSVYVAAHVDSTQSTQTTILISWPHQYTCTLITCVIYHGSIRMWQLSPDYNSFSMFALCRRTKCFCTGCPVLTHVIPTGCPVGTHVIPTGCRVGTHVSRMGCPVGTHVIYSGCPVRTHGPAAGCTVGTYVIHTEYPVGTHVIQCHPHLAVKSLPCHTCKRQSL